MKLNIWILFFATVADVAFSENTPSNYPEAIGVRHIKVVRDLRKTKGDTLSFLAKKPKQDRSHPLLINVESSDGGTVFSDKMKLLESSAEVQFEDVPQSDNKVEHAPLTFYTIKKKLKASGVFDWNSPNLSKEERKQLKSLRKTIEIMITSRARQPSNVQNTFASLRSVQRIVKKLVANGQISESLANKFNWQIINNV